MDDRPSHPNPAPKPPDPSPDAEPTPDPITQLRDAFQGLVSEVAELRRAARAHEVNIEPRLAAAEVASGSMTALSTNGARLYLDCEKQTLGGLPATVDNVELTVYDSNDRATYVFRPVWTRQRGDLHADAHLYPFGRAIRRAEHGRITANEFGNAANVYATWSIGSNTPLRNAVEGCNEPPPPRDHDLQAEED